MGRNWHYGSAALVTGRSRPTESGRLVGVRVACALDRKVVNGWVSKGGNYEKRMRKECIAGKSSWVGPKPCEYMGYVGEEAFGRGALGWECLGRRKG